MTEPASDLDGVIEVLREKLPAALGTPTMPGTEGWTLRSVRTERFFGHTVASLVLGNDDGSFQGHLFPANALETPYYRDDRFDFVYIDDASESRGRRHREVIDQFVRWLGVTFRARVRRLAPVPPATVTAPAGDERRSRSDDGSDPAMELETECLAIENELSQALRDGSLLPTLDRWTLEGVALSLFRDREVPSLKLAHEGRSLVLYLLPAGADEQAFYRTERYDVLYDDDAQSSNYTRCHAVLERLVAWLGATFPARVPRPAPVRPATVRAPAGDERRPRSDDGSDPAMDLETECLAIENELSQALRDGSLLPTLDRWTLEGVALSLFRDREVPSLKLAHEGRSLVLYLLPAGADEQAFYRTERYDVLYDDDAHSSNYTRCHAVLERLVAWLGATFPADEELRRQELARRRAARMQKLSHDPALVALSDEVSQKLRAALDAGAFTLPEGWRFEESLVEAQQGAAAVAVRFARAQGAFIFRLLATDPARQAYLRTSRFDVLYDSAEGDWQTQDEPLARRFVLWLDEAFPASSAPPAAPPSGDAPRPVRRPATAIDPAMTALARALDQGLSEALGTSALPNPEGWTLKHVAVQEFQGATAVEAVFLLRDRTVIFYVMPTNTENRAFRRTKSLDVLYEGDTEGVHFARDRALIEAVTEWIATWDAARAP